MKTKYLFYALIPCALFALMLIFAPKLNRPTNIATSLETVNTIYKTDIPLKNDYFTSNVYYPTHMEMDSLSFRNICNFFNINTNLTETDNYYKFENTTSTAYFYFKNGLFQYANLDKKTKYTKLSEIELLDLSKKYFEESMLPLNYGKSEIVKENDNYRIKFINTLDGIDNYSFNNNILIDKYGNIIELNYYFIEFQKVDRKKTMSMKECFNNLPTTLNNSKILTINDIQLTYILEDSLVQTAYKFDIKDDSDNFYEIYVKNTIY